MKLLDILLERTESRLKEDFLMKMKQFFPYGKGCRYDFGNQENFTKNSTVNVHCKRHNVDFPALVEYLLKGRTGPNGCGECKKDDGQSNVKSTKNDFYDKAKNIWKDGGGNPLYVYNRPGLKRYTGAKESFDFYCPKIGVDGKPHGKQTLLYAFTHTSLDSRHPEYPYKGCQKCKEEQGIVNQNSIGVSRVDFIKKIKEKMKSFHIPLKWYDWKGMEYTTKNSNAKIKCIEHGEEVFRNKAKDLYLGIPLCSKCKIIAISEKDFMNKVHKIYDNRFVLLSDYVNKETPVTLGCTLHGEKPYPVVIYPSAIDAAERRDGSIQCKECDRINYLKNFVRRFEIAQENRSIKYTYPDLDKEFVNANTKIPIECHVKGSNNREHGTFWQTPANHSTGQGCPICQESRNEMYIKNLFESKKYKFETQKQFKKLGNQKFDFYLPKPYNVLIEYDGKQHFEPTFGKSEYTRQLNYNILYESDNIKNEFVETNNSGLRMIRIPYTLKEGQYDKLLEDKLKVVEKNKIESIGDYPERQLPKEPVHKDKINLNESKLSLIDTVKDIYIL
jgi:very-short-patch-repair endonuclease